MPEPRPLDPSYPLAGRDLRHAALVVIDRHGPASIAQIIEALTRRGFRIWGRDPRKTLSDALRYETKLGRARRVGWGRYGIAHLARTTRWRITTRLLAAHVQPDGPDDHDIPRACEGTAIPWSRHDRRYPYDFKRDHPTDSYPGRRALARFMHMQRSRRRFREHLARQAAGLPPAQFAHVKHIRLLELGHDHPDPTRRPT